MSTAEHSVTLILTVLSPVSAYMAAKTVSDNVCCGVRQSTGCMQMTDNPQPSRAGHLKTGTVSDA